MPKTYKCAISGKELPLEALVNGFSIRSSIRELILKDYPFWKEDSYISTEILSKYRLIYVEKLLKDEKGDLDKIDTEIINQMKKSEKITTTNSLIEEKPLTFGERAADKIASFGGSWNFLISFALFIFIWILINAYFLGQNTFDPFPFILLNLLLSCLASVQAPLIMMSQNRQEARDRQRAEMDFKINLKAELEISLLSEKVDHIVIHQQTRIMELLLIQSDMLQEIQKKYHDNTLQNPPIV